MTTRDNKIYFFLYNQPENNQIILKGITTKISKVYALDNTNETFSFAENKDNISITIPASYSKKNEINVIVIEGADKITYKPTKAIALKPSLELNKENSQRHYSFSAVDYYASYRSTVKHTWHVTTPVDKAVQPVLMYSNEEKDKQVELLINDIKTPVTFSDGTPVALNNTNVKWGTTSISVEKKQWLLFDDLPGDIKNIDLQKKWGKEDWTVVKDWKNDTLYEKQAGMFTNWFSHHEVVSDKATKLLVSIPTNDGLAVYLNGEELYTINNPTKDYTKQTTVLLPLEKGVNKLLVKHSCRYEKNIKMGIVTKIPQTLYKKALPEIKLIKDRFNKIDLQLPAQYPVHQNINTPNVSIELK
jgi:alpha-L-fucosidase